MKYKVDSGHGGIIKLSHTERWLLNQSSRRIPFTALRSAWEAAKRDTDNRIQTASTRCYDEHDWAIASSCGFVSIVSRGNHLDDLNSKRDAMVQLLHQVNLMEIAELEAIYAIEPIENRDYATKPPIEPL